MRDAPASDEQFALQALNLAAAGIALVSPNPAVGAVIVDRSNRIVGTGTHTYEGKKHAEVLALEQAHTAARGATLYLNLEPCSHQGRTGPCADAVIASGIRRVVCSMQDPNPKVAGQGFAKLRAAGIQVDIGLLEAEAKKLNESFAKHIRTRKPLITLKSALSLDGKIAVSEKLHQNLTEDGLDPWITGPEARAHVQQLRHEHDAILVGVGTVLADDPLLTDRSNLPRRRKLLRVILDSNLTIPLDSQLIRSADNDVLVLCASGNSNSKEDSKKALLEKGVRVHQLESESDGRLDFAAIATYLGGLEITSLLVEGGSSVNASALQSGEVDKLFLYYAPKILGPDAVPFLSDRSAWSKILPLHRIAHHRFADDFAIEGYLRDPYSK
jgi:diaminohydroxyphosphoribosylaminopyrimidine deaminase/5-amino-6-(5-phosphoribosylamino)uracil reductase